MEGIATGKVKLQNNGGFVVKLQFDYYEEGTKRWIRSKSTGDITLGFSKTVDPGDYGVPDGRNFRVRANVFWGMDNVSEDMFTYMKNDSFTADFTISGTTLNNHLEFHGKNQSPARAGILEDGSFFNVCAAAPDDDSELIPSDPAEIEQSLQSPSLANSGSYGPLNWYASLDIDPADIKKSRVALKLSLFGCEIVDVVLDAKNPKTAVNFKSGRYGITGELGLDFDKRNVYLKGSLNIGIISKEIQLILLGF